MPKYNRHFHGDPTQVLECLDQEIRKSTYTISLVEESQTELSGVSCVLRLYEAYRIDGSRADRRTPAGVLIAPQAFRRQLPPALSTKPNPTMA